MNPTTILAFIFIKLKLTLTLYKKKIHNEDLKTPKSSASGVGGTSKIKVIVFFCHFPNLTQIWMTFSDISSLNSFTVVQNQDSSFCWKGSPVGEGPYRDRPEVWQLRSKWSPGELFFVRRRYIVLVSCVFDHLCKIDRRADSAFFFLFLADLCKCTCTQFLCSTKQT